MFGLSYAKALVPTLAALLVIVLSHFGITPVMTVEQAVTLLAGGLATSLGVWATPNKG